jgi:sugar phosphate isomerase/epimerase
LKRRKFINNIFISALGISSISLTNPFLKSSDFPYKLSLAQFSLFRLEMSKKFNPMDFAKISNELGFKGLEYLQMSYRGTLLRNNRGNKLNGIKNLAMDLNTRAEDYGMENVLIMIDIGPDLGNDVDNFDEYYSWIDCASYMKCQSVRVNLRGSDNNLSQWTQKSIKNLILLCEYAKPLNINIIVENHGGFSSNADYLVNVIEKVNNDNVGTLPDFGNFCIRQDEEKYMEMYKMFSQGAELTSDRPPTLYDSCIDRFDMYNGVEKLMRYAKGVSAKTHGFDSNGDDVDIDYKRMLQIVKDSGYSGFIGVEAQAFTMDPIEAIEASKKLLLNSYS